MSYDQFHRRLSLCTSMPQSLVSLIIRIARKTDDAGRRELLKVVTDSLADFNKHKKKAELFEKESEELFDQISNTLWKYGQVEQMGNFFSEYRLCFKQASNDDLWNTPLRYFDELPENELVMSKLSFVEYDHDKRDSTKIDLSNKAGEVSPELQEKIEWSVLMTHDRLDKLIDAESVQNFQRTVTSLYGVKVVDVQYGPEGIHTYAKIFFDVKNDEDIGGYIYVVNDGNIHDIPIRDLGKDLVHVERYDNLVEVTVSDPGVIALTLETANDIFVASITIDSGLTSESLTEDEIKMEIQEMESIADSLEK